MKLKSYMFHSPNIERNFLDQFYMLHCIKILNIERLILTTTSGLTPAWSNQFYI